MPQKWSLFLEYNFFPLDGPFGVRRKKDDLDDQGGQCSPRDTTQSAVIVIYFLTARDKYKDSSPYRKKKSKKDKEILT